MPDQSQQFSKTTPPKQQQEDVVNNPSNMLGNNPADATPESLASNVNRASEGEKVQAAQTIEGDPVVSSGDENASGSEGGAAGDNYDDEDAWPYRALQHEAKERTLDASGKRDEIIARLRESDSSGGTSSASRASGSSEGPAVASNGGIKQSSHATLHAEILQRDSDERRAQQRQAVAARSSVNNSSESDEN